MCEKVMRPKTTMKNDTIQKNIYPNLWCDRFNFKGTCYRVLKIPLQLLFVALTLTFMIWVSFFGYATVYYYIIPAVTLVFPVHLELGVSCGTISFSYLNNEYPTAVISLSRSSQNQLMPGIQYKVDLELELPESNVNQGIGMFNVEVSFLSRKKQRIESSTRSTMLHYKSYLLQCFQRIFFLPSLIFGMSEEKQKIVITMFENFQVPPNPQIEGIRVLIKSCDIQIYKAALRIEANLSGLRYYMLHWPLISASVGIGMGQCFLFSIFLLSWYRYLWPLQKALFTENLNSGKKEKAISDNQDKNLEKSHTSQNLAPEDSSNVSSTSDIGTTPSLLSSVSKQIDSTCSGDIPANLFSTRETGATPSLLSSVSKGIDSTGSGHISDDKNGFHLIERKSCPVIN